MMELPLASDPNVLELLYERFPCLSGYSLELPGSFADGAHLGTLEDGAFLGLVVGHAPTVERPSADHFNLLSPEQNVALIHYRLLQPVELWPQPLLGVLWDECRSEGTVLETKRVKVALHPVGSAQLWWGEEESMIWEACFTRPEYNRSPALLHGLWTVYETFLISQGIEWAFTYDRDPAFDGADYQNFLTARGYTTARASLLVKEPLPSA